MNWYWWIVVAIVAYIVLTAIGKFLRSPAEKSLPEEPLPEGSATAFTNAMEAIRVGGYAAAESILLSALKRVPPVSECEGTTAKERFDLLLLLSDVVRKHTNDENKRLKILNECAELVARPSFPRLQPESDRGNMMYMMYMNRAIAANDLKFYLLAEESLSDALQVALEPETKCKCLAFQAWAILQQQDSAKINQAWTTVGEFDRWLTPNVPPPLIVQAETARAVLSLLRNDVETACAATVKASRLAPTNWWVSELEQVLMRQRPSDSDAWELLRRNNQTDVPKVAPPQPLSPLPPGIIQTLAHSQLGSVQNGSIISDQEVAEFETKAHLLITAGEYVQLETLARQMLTRHTGSSIGRAFLLHSLARVLMRQGKTDEALTASGESIRLAHRYNDATQLAMMLDHHAEIHCFRADYLPALRALAAAEQYLRERKIANSYVSGWIAHTRGMAYQGCGWWDRAASNLREAIQTAKHFRHWEEWAGAAGDFVGLVLKQTEAEGPDLPLLEEALSLLVPIHQQFEVAGNEHLTLQTKIHCLMIENHLAIARKDTAELVRIHQRFVAIIKEYGGPHGLLPQLGGDNLFQWTFGVCYNIRAMVRFKAISEAKVKQALNEQQRLLKRAIEKAPGWADLWREMARLHLERARHGLDDSTVALAAAAYCMEEAMEIVRSLARDYFDPQVRAGLLGNASDLLATLAEIATFALKETQPANSDIAERMVSLAQYLRTRSHQDLVRNPPGTQSFSDHSEMQVLLARIRSLHCWVDRLDAQGWRKRGNPSRGLGNAPVNKHSGFANLLELTVTQITQQYPEYALFEKRGQVEDELRNRKQEFDQIASDNRLLHWEGKQIESEAPFVLSKLQARLRDGEVVLDYYVGSATLHVAVIAHRSLQVLRLPVDDMRKFRQVIKQNLIPDDGTLSLALGMRQCSAWLFPQELVDWLNELGERLRLYIVASGPLWKVPFPWLDAMGQLVLERWATCIIPAAQLAGSGQMMNGHIKAFAIGHPGPPTDFLASVEGEVKEVKTLMECPVLFQTEATPQRILREVLPQADVIHFACHGKCDPISPLISCLLLEPDEQHPDGRLMLHEVLGLPLRATVISLGACQTAKSEGPVTFPESLAHMLLGAGVSFVIASLWDANDDECRHFARGFYSALKQGAEPVVAFHQTQLQQAKALRQSAKQCGYGFFSDNDFARVSNFILIECAKTD